MEEVININLNGENSSDSNSKVNFGPGIELLMNDKKKTSSESTTIGMDDLDKLESDMNNLTESINVPGISTNVFSVNKEVPDIDLNVDNLDNITDSNLGNAMGENIGNTQTWDGFNKFNEIPNEPIKPKMNEREMRRKKRAMLKKLDEWYEKGHIKNMSQFDLNSPFDEIEDEYETVMEDKRKKDSVKLQGWWFMTFVNSLEYANTAFNPFDLNLEGWGETSKRRY